MRSCVRLPLAAPLVVLAACGAPTGASDPHPPPEPTEDTRVVRWYHRPVPATREVMPLGSRTSVAYLRLRPARCSSPRLCPVVVAVGGGTQTENLARESIRPWAQDLHDAGYLVLAPIAPGPDELFFEGGAELLVAFIEAAAERYMTPGERLVLFGVSNGGLSAFRVSPVVRDHLERVVVAPGFARTTDQHRLVDLAGLRVHIFVGADDDWLAPAEDTVVRLRAAEARVTLRVFDGVGHLLASALRFEELNRALGGAR